MYSKCGTSKIDIVILRTDTTPQENVFVAGAVIEMKTCEKEALTPDNEAQTAYEMLKLGTDMAIEDNLSRGEDVDVVIVHGILVDMKRVQGLLMELALDFADGTATCFKDTKQIELKKAFQVAIEPLTL